MTTKSNPTPQVDNAPGRFYVDENCLYHGLCESLAPLNFAKSDSGDHWRVTKQPENVDELAQVFVAMQNCPMAAIHDRESEHRPWRAWSWMTSLLAMDKAQKPPLDGRGT